MKTKLVLTLFFLGFILNGFSQNKKYEFTVNKSITDSINDDVNVDTIGQHILGKMYFHIVETYDIDEFKIENASDVTFFLEMQKLLKKDYMESVCDCELVKDSLIISGGQGYAGGIAFRLVLFDNYCTGQVWLQTVDSVYKIKETDKKFLNEIVLTLSDIKLAIQAKPSYTKDEQIHGKAILFSESFYQLTKTKELKKINLQFDIEFSCHVDE
jgi:hypothetical protein